MMATQGSMIISFAAGAMASAVSKIISGLLMMWSVGRRNHRHERSWGSKPRIEAMRKAPATQTLHADMQSVRYAHIVKSEPNCSSCNAYRTSYARKWRRLQTTGCKNGDQSEFLGPPHVQFPYHRHRHTDDNSGEQYCWHDDAVENALKGQTNAARDGFIPYKGERSAL